MKGHELTDFDVVVVGAGHAGLGIGYHLQQSDVRFVVLERGEIGDTWRSQRWDSFTVNTPNWMNGLPGSPHPGANPDGFVTRDELVAAFERHAAAHALPIRLGVTVERVTQGEEPHVFHVDTVDATGHRDSLLARNVVVASGVLRAPRIPAVHVSLPDSIEQLHASDYRSSETLDDGAVVVIGSGQSGCQIAEDLIAAGRTVYLCTSRVGRVPRRYRGRDALAWMTDMGMFDQQPSDLPDPLMQFAAQPQISGVGPLGRTVSLQSLHDQGVRLLGRLDSVVDGVLHSDKSLAEHVSFADEFSIEFKQRVDDYIVGHGLDAPAAEADPFDVPAGPDVAGSGLTSVDLERSGVSTAIWCTGFTSNLDWLDVGVMDDSGNPLHERGIAPVAGIYFLGFPWLHTRKSGIIFGIDEDARHIAEAISTR